MKAPLFILTIFVLLPYWGCGMDPVITENSAEPVNAEWIEPSSASLPTYVGSVIVTNPSELEALRGFVVIQGNVFINPLVMADLEPLSSLQKIEGTLDIAYDLMQVQSLKSLYGLHNLKAVSGYMQIENCDLLEHLGGLDVLKVVGASLSIYNNDGLGSVDALGNLELVGMNLNILNNPYLPCYEAEALIDGMGENSVGGVVSVQNNGDAVNATCL